MLQLHIARWGNITSFFKRNETHGTNQKCLFFYIAGTFVVFLLRFENQIKQVTPPLSKHWVNRSSSVCHYFTRIQQGLCWLFLLVRWSSILYRFLGGSHKQDINKTHKKSQLVKSGDHIHNHCYAGKCRANDKHQKRLTQSSMYGQQQRRHLTGYIFKTTVSKQLQNQCIASIFILTNNVVYSQLRNDNIFMKTCSCK